MMLDELVAARSPKLIKIDVEGGDLDVLKGARSVIARDAPIVCVEAAGAREFCDIADFLQTFGMAPVATYNYTPTHVFRAWNYEGDQSMLASIAVSTGLLYIRHYELRKILHTRLQSLTDKILSVEANVASAPHRKPRKREKGRGVRGA
jgi:hypothetical protein